MKYPEIPARMSLGNFHVVTERWFADAFEAPTAAQINGWAGHVMLSEGNGNYITTAPTVRRVTLNWPGATYLGWSWANSNWPGR